MLRALITTGVHNGVSLKVIAEDFREDWQGQEPKPFDFNGNDAFVFVYTDADGIKGTCVVTGDEKNFLAIAGTGEDPGIDAIIESIKPNK